MESDSSLRTAPILAEGSTATIYEWTDDTVLKLFKQRSSWHTNEITSTKVAYESGLPVPRVCSGLLEIGQQEGIMFERVDGPTMADFLEDHPEDAEHCGTIAADLQSRMHSIEGGNLPLLKDILSWSIHQTNFLETKIKKLVEDILAQLPILKFLCHCDFYPRNLLMSPQGPMIIDWAIGTRGNPTADLARTWLISRLLLDMTVGSDSKGKLWKRFWDTFFRRYKELNPNCFDQFLQWQIVIAAASLVWDEGLRSMDSRLSFINAALSESDHPWLRA